MLVWVAAFRFFSPPHALLLGTALLAYTFGLRHAVDADHICAIDNVTRKLMQEGKRPVGVGLFFSLGHSTIVVLLTLVIVLGAGSIRSHLPSLESFGGARRYRHFGGLPLHYRRHQRIRAASTSCKRCCGGDKMERSARRALANRSIDAGCSGVSSSLCCAWSTRSRHMYLIGVLFGLGFDTATEVGLLGIAAIEAGKGLPVWAILIFPALFTAGMSLVDTTDGVLMLGAYGWAFLKPERKLYYNLAITSASVLVAVVVGGVELTSIAGANVSVGWLGFAIVGAFALAWAARRDSTPSSVIASRQFLVAVEVSVSNGRVPSAKSHASKMVHVRAPERIGQRADVRVVANPVAGTNQLAERAVLANHVTGLQA